MGCYPIHFFQDLFSNYNDFVIEKFDHDNLNKQFLKLISKSGKINLIINVGVGYDYENLVKFNFLNNKFVIFNKFFYGRQADKEIIVGKDNELKKEKIKDINSFEKNVQYFQKKLVNKSRIKI